MARILDRVKEPQDLKGFALKDLQALATEIREEIITVVSEAGGHFASPLGAVELTVALHRVFDAPSDRLVWDVGHQAYAHKILTGRLERLNTIRQLNGLSGFLSREESPYDTFGAGHAGTSISAALGMAEGIRMKGGSNRVVAILGDGGMTAGMAYEGLNQAGHLKRPEQDLQRLIVVLNDNAMSISRNVGALSAFLSKSFTGNLAVKMQKSLKDFLLGHPGLGENIYHAARKFKESFIGLVTPGILFEALGFQYVGPIDGHDLAELVETFENVRRIDGPVVVHAVTQKGKGYALAEKDPVAFHGVNPFHILTGKAKKEKSKIPAFTSVFGQALVELAKNDRRIVAITAAMQGGTGLDAFAREFPDRFYDVGIAEQHGITFAAGLAAEGLIPVAAIYSTFLQRAFDQIIHDVCVQKLHVVFALDRAGLTGADGPTHHGVFDFAYLRPLPGMVVMAPKDENELRSMLLTAIRHEGPIALRYPRGNGWGVPLDEVIEPLPIGKGEVPRPGKHLAILAIGNTVIPSLRAAEILVPLGIDCEVVNARFVKPLDKELIVGLCGRFDQFLTVEDHVMHGGFGSAVLELLSSEQMHHVRVQSLSVPDRFIPHGTQEELRRLCSIDEEGITQAVIKLAQREKRQKQAQRKG